MGTVASARQQVKSDAATNVIPDAAAVPAAHTDMLAIANALEKLGVMRVASVAAASSLNPPQEGMVIATTSAPFEIYRYSAAAPAGWKKVWPMIYSGTGVPGAGTGADGDIYVMY